MLCPGPHENHNFFRVTTPERERYLPIHVPSLSRFLESDRGRGEILRRFLASSPTRASQVLESLVEEDQRVFREVIWHTNHPSPHSSINHLSPLHKHHVVADVGFQRTHGVEK